VFQILRGSEMLFAALFAVLFLKRHLNRWHFIGVALCMVSSKRKASSCSIMISGVAVRQDAPQQVAREWPCAW
jgi:drug/metabolite transporter (DMT)-like permease